jgi:hypothetical protein
LSEAGDEAAHAVTNVVVPLALGEIVELHLDTVGVLVG